MAELYDPHSILFVKKNLEFSQYKGLAHHWKFGPFDKEKTIKSLYDQIHSKRYRHVRI